jgi:ABC-type Fe3+ transport system permease subunit
MARRWSLLRHLVGPLALPQFAAAWYLVFLLCLWDGESIVLITPPGVETLALRAFNLLHYGHNAHVNAICLTLLAVALAPLALWAISDFGFQISIRAARSQRLGGNRVAGRAAGRLCAASPLELRAA